MDMVHPIFGLLELDDLDRPAAIQPIRFAGREKEIKISFEDGEIPEAYSLTYAALTEKLDSIAPDILRAILNYQHEHYHDSGHTEEFLYFETAADVSAHTELFEISLRSGLSGSGLRGETADHEKPGRYAVLLFSAEWVGDDYGVLSVALANEQVVCVTDQAITE